MAEQEKASTQSPRKIDVREFRSNFSGFMRQVRHGASLIVTSRDEVVAVIQPPQPAPPSGRRPGTLRGWIEIAPDFDGLPPELLAVMEIEGALGCSSIRTLCSGGSPGTRRSTSPPEP